MDSDSDAASFAAKLRAEKRKHPVQYLTKPFDLTKEISKSKLFIINIPKGIINSIN